MATLTRLASTLTAKYFPSQTLTDSFYIDGRLFGKRETRSADITIDKEERGFFLSVFAHPRIPEYEPGMMPPYEPDLRRTCNDVKFGRKEIDGMIEGFLNTAVDVTGKMRLSDNNRSPYFSGVIVRDAEAFAVTIGSGLAFLYRDDTLFPLTDAGIPMEPIDVDGNRVGDFLYYCSSKTANALWSNFFTLSPDDCIILCNKEVYDALGQREILRILNEAEDQCDAAGVIITQASARMPNVPMQFSISFVESVTSDEKRGLFGFRKKAKEEDMSDMSISSSFDAGVVGAAAEATASAGFTSSIPMTDSAEDSDILVFGDDGKGPAAPATNQTANANAGIELDQPSNNADINIDFFDSSVKSEPVVEMTPEEMMKSLLKDTAVAAATTTSAVAAEKTAEESLAAAVSETPIVATFNPFDMPVETPVADDSDMKIVSEAPFALPVDDDNDKTKPIERIDSDFIASLQKDQPIKKEGIIEAALRDMGVEPVEAPAEEAAPANSDIPLDLDSLFGIKPAEVAEEKQEVEPVVETPVAPVIETPAVEVPVVSDNGELVFSEASVATEFGGIDTTAVDEAFNPYSEGDSGDMKDAGPIVFGDDGNAVAPDFSSVAEDETIPEFKLVSDAPVVAEEDKLPIDFPVIEKKKEVAEVKAVEDTMPAPDMPEEIIEEPIAEALVSEPVEEKIEDKVEESKDALDLDSIFTLPFANTVETIPEEKPAAPVAEDIPDMPLYNANTFDSPVAAVNSEQPVNSNPDDVYTYGQNQEVPYMSDSYQPFGNEANNYTPNDMNNENYQYYQEGTQDAASQSVDQGYTDFGNDSSYSAPDSGVPMGDDFINSILGISDDDDMGVAYTPNATSPEAGSPDIYGGYEPETPVAPSAPVAPARQSSPKPKTATGGSRSGNGNGGNGGTKIKLNRNGYMFLAVVAFLIICFILIISVIVKSCSKSEKPKETEATTTPIELVETTPAPTPVPAVPENDSLAPMGRFYFSDSIGYKCWWDLFNKVYNIQLLNENDPKVQILIDYNNYYAQINGQAAGIPAGYIPQPGDQFLLPSLEVISGDVIIPDASNPAAQGGTVQGTISITDGAETEAATPEGGEVEVQPEA